MNRAIESIGRGSAAMEAQVRGYGVDIMNSQRVTAIEPATKPGGEITVTLANGAALKSRSVVLATGARWRNVNVPGEDEYRNKGVAYCPHCDGPLFKGKLQARLIATNKNIIHKLTKTQSIAFVHQFYVISG